MQVLAIGCSCLPSRVRGEDALEPGADTAYPHWAGDDVVRRGWRTVMGGKKTIPLPPQVDLVDPHRPPIKLTAMNSGSMGVVLRQVWSVSSTTQSGCIRVSSALVTFETRAPKAIWPWRTRAGTHEVRRSIARSQIKVLARICRFGSVVPGWTTRWTRSGSGGRCPSDAPGVASDSQRTRAAASSATGSNVHLYACSG